MAALGKFGQSFLSDKIIIMIFTVLKLFAWYSLDHTDDLLARHAANEDIPLENSINKELNLWFRDEGSSVGREKLVN
jgi:hypothetical protein